MINRTNFKSMKKTGDEIVLKKIIKIQEIPKSCEEDKEELEDGN